MIKYSLKCQLQHVFEGWFNNSKDYDKQSQQSLLQCPFCDDINIVKAPMSPSIHRSSKHKKQNIEPDPKQDTQQNHANSMQENASNQPQMVASNYNNLRNFLAQKLQKDFENVGTNFSKKVREMYYDEIPKKSIYGTATIKETSELIEEGIDVMQLPYDLLPSKPSNKLN